MTTTLPGTTSASLRSMTAIEARRFVRHPLFLVGVLAAYALTLLLNTVLAPDDGGVTTTRDLLSQPIVPAFFIGLPSMIVAARLTRSTEVAAEALGAAPGTEAQRTRALLGACGVPLLAGLGWLVMLLVLARITPPHPHELWFGTVNSLYVWSLLLALGVVACLGGGVLGVLVGRWLRFRGASTVALVVVVGICLTSQIPAVYTSEAAGFRNWVPWSMWHLGTTSDGEPFYGVPGWSQGLLAGNPATYLVYLLVLCALAGGGAIWHDRTARTPRLRLLNVGLVAAAVALLLVTALSGIDQMLISAPLQ